MASLPWGGRAQPALFYPSGTQSTATPRAHTALMAHGTSCESSGGSWWVQPRALLCHGTELRTHPEPQWVGVWPSTAPAGAASHSVLSTRGDGADRRGGLQGLALPGGGQEGPHCCLSAAPASASRVLNGTALCRAERYGWAIEEKLERKIYNFPFKPVIHVINIDVI